MITRKRKGVCGGKPDEKDPHFDAVFFISYPKKEINLSRIYQQTGATHRPMSCDLARKTLEIRTMDHFGENGSQLLIYRILIRGSS